MHVQVHGNFVGVKFSPRAASHRARGQGSGRKAYSSRSTTTTTRKQASPHPASHRARGRGRRRTKQASPCSASSRDTSKVLKCIEPCL